MAKTKIVKLSKEEMIERAHKPEEFPEFIPTTYIGRIPPTPKYCRGWNSKREKYCKQWAGHNTDHKGEGRCQWHGKGGVLKHGRYSTVARDSLKKHLERIQEEGGDRADLTQEVDMLRALVADFLERWQEILEALLAWNKEEARDSAIEGRRSRPQRLPGIESVSSLLKDAADLADKMHRQRYRDAIPKRDFFRLQEAQSDVVAKKIRGIAHIIGQETADDILGQISDEWEQIRL